ncbi:MAG: putative mycothiol-dependent maleylpyruvate isomerase [Mycobacterium sp.]|nr:putative mycothiol-dependent maleylpyruvate isomerase [Mycobacterium sp.]
MSEPTMDAPPPALLDEVVAATARLLSTVDGLGDWPRWFVAGAMPRVVHTMRDLADLTLDATDTGTLYRLRTGTARTVHGPLNALFAWLTGRSDGADLAVDPPGTLPEPPPWK